MKNETKSLLSLALRPINFFGEMNKLCLFRVLEWIFVLVKVLSNSFVLFLGIDATL